VDAGGIVVHGARRKQVPGDAVDEELIVADEAGIGGEDTLLAGRVDLAALVGDHERAALVDRDKGGPDLDLHGHAAPPYDLALMGLRTARRGPRYIPSTTGTVSAMATVKAQSAGADVNTCSLRRAARRVSARVRPIHQGLERASSR
jgi:hypothetical protein